MNSQVCRSFALGLRAALFIIPFALIAQTQRVAAPTFSPQGGIYTGSVSVAIACATPGATVFYSLGANTAGGTATVFQPYTGPVTLSASAVVLAKASASGLLDSSAYAAYTVVVPRAAMPTFSPAPGV